MVPCSFQSPNDMDDIFFSQTGIVALTVSASQLIRPSPLELKCVTSVRMMCVHEKKYVCDD